MQTMTAVQANRSAVSRYTFASYRARPMPSRGAASTSAATPAFHASPIPVRAAARKKGITAGRRMCRSTLPGDMRNTRAISSRAGSVCRTP